MKLLLDDCLPLDFRHELRGHVADTVQWARIKGIKNGELLQAESAEYDVLLTGNQGISRQISPASRRLAVVVLRSATNRLRV